MSKNAKNNPRPVGSRFRALGGVGFLALLLFVIGQLAISLSRIRKTSEADSQLGRQLLVQFFLIGSIVVAFVVVLVLFASLTAARRSRLLQIKFPTAIVRSVSRTAELDQAMRLLVGSGQRSQVIPRWLTLVATQKGISFWGHWELHEVLFVDWASVRELGIGEGVGQRRTWAALTLSIFHAGEIIDLKVVVVGPNGVFAEPSRTLELLVDDLRELSREVTPPSL